MEWMDGIGFGDLHRHDEFSTFDGFGKADENAQAAKEKGYTCLGLTNHGNTNGLVRHYHACKNAGIIPVLGVEAYMLPVYKPQERGYHLCLFAKNTEGYKNINKIQFAGEKQKYYNPIVTFEILEKYSSGVIASSACVQGYMARALLAGRRDLAVKYADRMHYIFGDDFYIEIQPYKIDDERTQERVNIMLMEVARETDTRCILTSDSHRARKEDFDTYMIMHQIAGHDMKMIADTYRERYMPTQEEIRKRFCNMHRDDFKMVGWESRKMLRNIDILQSAIDPDIMDGFKISLPVFDKTKNSKKLLKEHVEKGLERRGKTDVGHRLRATQELNIVFDLDFEDYFLMVEDYCRWARDHGIIVGPGRGSGCNFLINYALGITDVDSLEMGLEPRRFLMRERKKMPEQFGLRSLTMPMGVLFSKKVLTVDA